MANGGVRNSEVIVSAWRCHWRRLKNRHHGALKASLQNAIRNTFRTRQAYRALYFHDWMQIELMWVLLAVFFHAFSLFFSSLIKLNYFSQFVKTE
jgi:hypothetical protein